MCSDHDGAESTVSGNKFFDEPLWGTKFDNDDADSVWGFSAISPKVRHFVILSYVPCVFKWMLLI